MSSFVRPELPLLATSPSDPRVGQLLGAALGPGEPPRAVLAGFPVDEGVRRNGGRTGAAAGPSALRRLLYAFTPDALAPGPFTELLGKTLDAGDLACSGDLARDQAALGEAVARWLEGGAFVLVLGGGHETAFGHFLAYAALARPVEILNLDAHADVRETKDGAGHSGSPFREALEHPSGACRRYSVAGLQPHSVARAHVDLVTGRGGQAVFAAQLTAERLRALFTALRAPALVSFDLDAVDQAFAPGVSAPAARGLSPERWLEAAFLAGRSPSVTSVDLAELNPAHDRDGQATRLAAVTIWEILRGLATRPGR
jgi:formiminoglutamase